MNFIINFVKGILIGSGAILPGISSGVLCVIFGLYDKLINSILSFFSDIKNNIKFLLPIALGGVIGVLLFSNIIKYAFNTFPSETQACFVGLILGCIPILIKEANNSSDFKYKYLIWLFLSFFIGIFLFVLEKNITLSEVGYCYNTYSIWYLILCGFCMSIGVVVPGVSSTIILMLLGVYDLYLFSVSTVNISVLFPIFIGLVIGGFVFMKITQLLFKKFFSETYYAIIGFSLGSIPILFPNFSEISFLAVILFICSLIVSYTLSNK